MADVSLCELGDEGCDSAVEDLDTVVVEDVSAAPSLRHPGVLLLHASVEHEFLELRVLEALQQRNTLRLGAVGIEHTPCGSSCRRGPSR